MAKITWLQKIGIVFSSLIGVAKRTFLRLPDNEQTALQSGVGIIDVINSHLDKTPTQIREAIEKKFPTLPITEIEASLFAVYNLFNLGAKKDKIEDVIEGIKKKLNSLEGQEWAIISHSFAVCVAKLLSPKETKLSKITSLIETVFQLFFKKSI